MSDRYNQYRILYCLYDAHINGQINGIDIMTLMQHESLKYIVRNKLIGKIYYLYGHGLIGIDEISSPFVKITSRGIDIVNIILDKYHNFLKDIRDANLDGAHNNILAMIDSVEKRRTTNFYITKNTDAFKRFLINTNIFDRLLTLPLIIFSITKISIYTTMDLGIVIKSSWI